MSRFLEKIVSRVLDIDQQLIHVKAIFYFLLHKDHAQVPIFKVILLNLNID
jgi:hypothetical protein